MSHQLVRAIRQQLRVSPAAVTTEHVCFFFNICACTQDMEMHSVPQKPWGAPVPSREEISRSLSMPLLSSPNAVHAREQSFQDSMALKELVSAELTHPGPALGATKSRPVTAPGKRPSTAKSRNPSPSRGMARTVAASAAAHASEASEAGMAIPAEGESFTAAQVRQLEDEVNHLRETVDVLLEARGLKKGSNPLSLSGSMRHSPVRSMSHQPPHEAAVATMRDKKRHDQRIVALQKESGRMRNPHTIAAATAPQYKRLPESRLGIKRVDPNPPPRPDILAEYEGGGKAREGISARRASLAMARRASAAGLDQATAAAAAAAAVSGGAGAMPSSSSPQRRASISINLGMPLSVPPPAAQQQQSGLGHGRPSTAAAGGRKGKAHHAAARPSTARSKENASAVRPATAGPAVGGRRMSKAELAATYAAPPGVSKANLMARPTGTQEFSFTTRDANGEERRISIREAKFLADLEAKRQAEEAALQYKFEAQPIAPATRDLNLYHRITEKQDHRRHALHAARAAKLASSFKPFTVVTSHCEEHAARQQARQAAARVAEDRELAESRRFRAIPVPSSTQNPDSEFFALIKREQERPARVAAYARALASTASLPPRMQLANENERRRKAEREARRREEEKRDKEEHKFEANDLPDFDGIYTSFIDTLTAARSSAATTVPTPFGFDQPERIAAEKARKERWTREFELQTSTSMALRRRSTAYAEGEDLTGDGGNATMRGRSMSRSRRGSTMSASGRMNGTGGSRTSRSRSRAGSIAAALSVNNAPPAAMTKSVQLKMLSVQMKLRSSQVEERQKQEGDEAYRAFIKTSTRRFAPLFQDMERQRVPIPLAWQMDKTTASASQARKAFESAARERELYNKQRIEEAQANRPLVMMRATIDFQRDTARAAAMHKVAATAARASGSSVQSVVDDGIAGSRVFSEDDREVMSSYGHTSTSHNNNNQREEAEHDHQPAAVVSGDDAFVEEM